MDDEYRTIARPSRVETKVQGSRFIGEALMTQSIAESQAALESIRQREYDATHHCYGYRVGHDGVPQFKYSDDGEPNGTAGRPIYDAICGAGLTDLTLVVTRYFGGTKLGTGGLAHAYADSAQLALKEAGVVTRYLTRTARCTFEFPVYEKWQRQLVRLGARVLDSQFTADVTLQIEIRRSKFAELRAAFTEMTAGKGRFEEI
jgi:uncharacterized YigZ family protein